MDDDYSEEETVSKIENPEIKISNKIIGCNIQKYFKGTAKYNPSINNNLIQEIIIKEQKINQRIFYKDNNKNIGYIEVFQNPSLSYAHQISENISLLFENDSKENTRINADKCFGFRYYDINKNYCTLLKSDDSDEDNYYFLEKNKEENNNFYDEKLDCFKIIFYSIFNRYKKKSNNDFDFQLISEMPIYEILGFSYSIQFKSTDKYIFHKIYSINVLSDKDFTSHIKKINDKTKLNIMPILFGGHISLLFFIDYNGKRIFRLSDPSHIHCKYNENNISLNPFIFDKEMRKHFFVVPKEKI